jgi:hypothetical protein
LMPTKRADRFWLHTARIVVQIHFSRLSRFIPHLKHGGNAFRGALDLQRLLRGLMRRISLNFDFPANVIVHHADIRRFVAFGTLRSDDKLDGLVDSHFPVQCCYSSNKASGRQTLSQHLWADLVEADARSAVLLMPIHTLGRCCELLVGPAKSICPRVLLGLGSQTAETARPADAETAAVGNNEPAKGRNAVKFGGAQS